MVAIVVCGHCSPLEWSRIENGEICCNLDLIIQTREEIGKRCGVYGLVILCSGCTLRILGIEADQIIRK